MVAFSGTNLLPILRLGGSADVVASIPEDTAGIKLAPRYLPSRCIESTTTVLGTVKLPMSVTSKTDRKSRKKDWGRRRKPQ